MKEKQYTYNAFLNAIESTSALLIEESVETVIQYFKPPHSIHSRFAPTTFLLDYATRKYLYVENSCFDVTGYTADYFLETGLDEFNKKWHPVDFAILNDKVFFDNILFLQKLSPGDYDKYIISYNYRFKNPNEEYITLLQRFSYIPGKTAIGPAGVVGIVFDISHFKNDATIVHTIERIDNTPDGTFNKLIFKKVHPISDQPDNRLLSNREKEILSLMAKGFSSKQIADLTSLSINTVNNHRKNMLYKTNSKSSSELINYASKHGLV